MNIFKPRSILVTMAVYESQANPGVWKGFCDPYGITTQADNCEETKKKLEELVDLYEEGLKKYSYPSHLVAKKLSDPEDVDVLKILSKDIQQKMKEKQSSALLNSRQRRISGDIRSKGRIASFYEPQFA